MRSNRDSHYTDLNPNIIPLKIFIGLEIANPVTRSLLDVDILRGFTSFHAFLSAP